VLSYFLCFLLPASHIRLSAEAFEEAAGARLTLLEGKVKFMENQLGSRQQQQGPPAAGTTGGVGLHSSRARTPAAATAVAVALQGGGGLPAQQFASR
jgi:hypothetical protein